MIILPGTPVDMFVVFNSLHHKMLVLYVIKRSAIGLFLRIYSIAFRILLLPLFYVLNLQDHLEPPEVECMAWSFSLVI